MGAPPHSPDGMIVPADSSGISIARIEGQVQGLSQAIRRVARRSRRFSWFSWGFLFAVYIGASVGAILSLVFMTTVTTTTLGGTSTTTTGAWWAYPVGLAPSIVLLVLAVREVLLGRIESRGEVSSLPPTGTRPEAPAAVNWTENVRQAQETLTRSRSEVEWSFVPLVLGMLGLFEFVLSAALVLVLSSWGALGVVLPLMLGFPFLLFLWPLYRVAGRWINRYQEQLTRQGKELSALENEFFWRFAGMPMTG